MSRKSHKKSRTGCDECKRRHIKCDEIRPGCVNCTTAELMCSFLRQLEYSDNIVSANPSSSPSPGIYTTSGQQYQVNLDHLELFGHFRAEAYRDFTQDTLTVDMICAIVQKHIRSAPYLVHQVLAVSALHLSITQTGRRPYYRQYAEGLQQEALRLFNRHTPHLDKVNCVPVLLYSSYLGIYMLCTTLFYRNGDPNDFLESFNQYLKLHRGVRAISASTWQYLQSSDLADILASAVNSATSSTGGNECETLTNLISSPAISSEARQVCTSTIEHLQNLFNVARECPGNFTDALCSWPITTPAEYSDLLAQRNPEALVILAYYGVLLHRQRHLWIIGDGAEFLVTSIARVLGEGWSDWLSWPVSQVQLPGHDSRRLTTSV